MSRKRTYAARRKAVYVGFALVSAALVSGFVGASVVNFTNAPLNENGYTISDTGTIYGLYGPGYATLVPSSGNGFTSGTCSSGSLPDVTSSPQSEVIVVPAETDTSTPSTTGDAALVFQFQTSSAAQGERDWFFAQGVVASGGTVTVYGVAIVPIANGVSGATVNVFVYVDYGSSLPTSISTLDVFVSGS